MQIAAADAVNPAPDRWIFAGLLALLVWLPLPWGSKSAAAVALSGFVAAALVVARLMLARRAPLPPLPREARIALALWLAWLGWCALHVFAFSILPGASFEQLILGANYLCLFWLTLVSVRRDRARQRLALTVLVFSGLAQALYGTVMTLSGLEYGFLEQKTHGLGWATGTFVNRNHLAGYLELTLAAGIALVLADLRSPGGETGWRQRLVGFVDLALSPRMRTRVMIVAMVVALVLTRSRMGNVAFFAALAVCANVYIVLRHPKYFAKSLLFFASLVVVDLLIVSEHYGLAKVAQRIEQTDFETEQRSVVFRDLAPAIEQHWMTGSGPGTFAAAFAPHRTADVRYHYDHAHNDYAEFLIETGIVGASLLGALVALTLAHGLAVLRRRRDPMAGAMAFAGMMGLVALGIHGLVDFNLRIPAVAATLVTLMALTLSVGRHSHAAGNPG